MKTLYNIYYIESPSKLIYEVTTDNFKKWLKQHNKHRIADGEIKESKSCFKVEEVYLKLFNKKAKK